MYAIRVEDDRLAWREVPDPVPRSGEALLRVRAAALNRADLAQRAGHYPPPPGESDILGLDAAGEVLEAPADSGWSAGDRACALLAGGGYAELAAVPAGMLMPFPGTWDWARAAALPEVFLTAHLNLFMEGRLQPGERLLVHGGGSGVGTAAIQLAREAGCRVVATASTGKLAACQELGAELAVDYRLGDFSERVADAFGEVDVILDMVGGSHVERNLKLLATGGRLVWIGTLGGTDAAVSIRQMMVRRLTLKGSVLRARPLEEKVRLRDAFLERFGPALHEGRVGPVLDRTFPIQEADAAHERMRRNENVGKIVLSVP